jgi:4-hydroxybenzoate polyprenyltransferase
MVIHNSIKPIIKAMKTLKWIGWVSLAIAALIILVAGISVITEKPIFGIKHAVNCFHAASTFILFTIALFIFIYKCNCKKE